MVLSTLEVFTPCATSSESSAEVEAYRSMCCTSKPNKYLIHSYTDTEDRLFIGVIGVIISNVSIRLFAPFPHKGSQSHTFPYVLLLPYILVHIRHTLNNTIPYIHSITKHGPLAAMTLNNTAFTLYT